MASSEGAHPARDESVREILARLERRVARIEDRLGLRPPAGAGAQVPGAAGADSEGAASLIAPQQGLEVRLGEVGLAWLAGLVLPLGIAFLMALIQGSGRPFLAALLGLAASGGLYVLSRIWREAYPYMARVLLPAAMLLLFYTAVRLHFFTDHPLIPWRIPGLAGLLVVVAVQVYLAIRRSSEGLALLGILMGALTALFADAPHLTLGLTVALSALSVLLLERRDWRGLAVGTLLLAYLTFFLWIVGLPVHGGRLELVTGVPTAAVYPFLLAGIFAVPALRFTHQVSSDTFPVTMVFFNTGGFVFAVALLAVTHFSEQPALIFLPASAYFMGWSMVLWRRTHASFAPAFYVCAAFLALTVAFYTGTGVPVAFFWLALQSLLVVSLALWYRSRLLVVANSLIFLLILAVYLLTGPIAAYVSFTFAGVALVSARVMNWKKERLELRTELLRNTYLVIASLMVLFGIDRAVPPQFVAMSWTAAAALWFGLSLLLRNVKYRWMAIGTLLATVVHLFLMDLARLDPGFRIAAFLGLGVIALAISLFYTRIQRLISKDEAANVS
jgi:hypothetical protein